MVRRARFPNASTTSTFWIVITFSVVVTFCSDILLLHFVTFLWPFWLQLYCIAILCSFISKLIDCDLLQHTVNIHRHIMLCGRKLTSGCHLLYNLEEITVNETRFSLFFLWHIRFIAQISASLVKCCITLLRQILWSFFFNFPISFLTLAFSNILRKSDLWYKALL